MRGNEGARPGYNGQWSGTDYEFKHFALHRHDKGTQVTFFDGHVSYCRARGLWRLYWYKDFDVTFSDSGGADFFPEWMR